MEEDKNLNNSQLNTDTENVKPNLHDIFQNPRLIGELYNNLSLSDTYALNSLEKLSHYIIVKKLYENISNIDKFASSKKTLKSCFKGDIDEMFFLYMALFPSMFSSFKELYMGKTSWQDYYKRLKDEDLKDLDKIKTIPSGLSNKQIISEIRNAINHTHYVSGKDELFIKNPKNPDPRIHVRNFEAIVPYSFLMEFIILAQDCFRKSNYYGFDTDDDKLMQRLWRNKEEIKYDDIKDKIHFSQGLTIDKDGVYKTSKDTEIKREVVRSEQVENLISKYFSNHKLERKNLSYIAESLINPPEVHMWEIFQSIIRNEISGNNKYKGLNSIELIDDVYKEMINGGFYGFFDGFKNVEGKEIIVNICEEIEKKHQDNGQAMLKHFRGCEKCAYEYLKKHGFSEYMDGDKEYFKKGDVVIETNNIYRAIDELQTHYYVISNMVKLFPNWLRLQLIKLVYINEQVSLQDENVEGLVSKMDATEDEHGKGKKPIRERIRDALSHHSYIILEGVDDIVLRDGYKKKTDSRDRETTFSLSKLFESTFKEISENDITPRYASLIEELNS